MGKSIVFLVVVNLALSVSLVLADTGKFLKAEGLVKTNAIISVYDKTLPAPTNGVIKRYYGSGELKTETPYTGGEKNGVEKVYMKSGMLVLETPYAKGKKSGVERWYHKSGKLMAEVPYRNGKKNGVEKIYYESGELKLKAPYTDGKKNGAEKWYYKSGELMESPYTNGRGKKEN